MRMIFALLELKLPISLRFLFFSRWNLVRPLVYTGFTGPFAWFAGFKLLDTRFTGYTGIEGYLGRLGRSHGYISWVSNTGWSGDSFRVPNSEVALSFFGLPFQYFLRFIRHRRIPLFNG